MEGDVVPAPVGFWVGGKHLFNLFHMTAGFFSVFVAFSATQNLLSSLLEKNMGTWSLAIIYGAFCFGSSVVATTAVHVLTPKWSLFVGSLGYVAFMAANLYPRTWTLYPSAALLGITASILWAAEGSYLTAAAGNYAAAQRKPRDAAVGLFNGLFFGVFQLTQVVGNVVGAVILGLGGDRQHAITFLFWCFFGVATFGAIIFTFLRSEKPQVAEHSSVNNYYADQADANGELEPPAPAKMGAADRLLEMARLLGTPRMLLCVPVLFYSGLELGFLSADFTAKVITPALGAENIGYIMAVFGVSDAISSLVLGRALDVFGKRVLLLLGFLTQLAFLLFFLVILHLEGIEWVTSHSYIIYIMVVLFGIGDAVWNTVPNVLMGIFWPTQTEAAFSNLKFWQSLGFALAVIGGPLMELEILIYVVVGTLVFCNLCLIVLDRCIGPLDAPTDYMPYDPLPSLSKRDDDTDPVSSRFD